MIFLVCAGPFGFYLLFRCFLPLVWCFNFIYTNNNHHNIELVYFHTFYLLINTFLCIKIIKYIAYSTIPKPAYHRSLYSRSEGSFGFYAAVFTFIFLYIVLGDQIPIFAAEGGSEALLNFSKQNKTTSWIIFGIIDLLILYFLVTFNSTEGKFKRYISLLLSLFGSISAGSKVGLVAFFGKFFTIQALFKKDKLSIKTITFLIISLPLSFAFILIQFARTLDINIPISSAVGVLITLVFNSSTSYLNQFIVRDGIMLSSQYAQMLGDFGFMRYFLNPFLVVFGYDGIGMSIGPYMAGFLYGQTNDGGINPILFFELIFIFGPTIGIPLSFIFMYLIFKLSKFLIKSAFIFKDTSKIMSACLVGMSFLCLTFLTDTLNAIRALPFFLIPFIVVMAYKRISKRNIMMR